MSNITSKLKIVDLYHEKFEFYQDRQNKAEKLNHSYAAHYFENVKNTNQIKVQLDIAIKDDNNHFKLTLSTVGIFELDNCDLSEEESKKIIHANTLAIIFPYVRSQVSLMTTQPGIQPILIPPININAMMETEKEQIQ